MMKVNVCIVLRIQGEFHVLGVHEYSLLFLHYFVLRLRIVNALQALFVESVISDIVNQELAS